MDFCCCCGFWFFLFWTKIKVKIPEKMKLWLLSSSRDSVKTQESIAGTKAWHNISSSEEQGVQLYGWLWRKGHSLICCCLQNCSKDKWSVIAHHTMIACWCHFLKWCDDIVVGPLTHLSLSAFVSIKLTGALCKYDFGQGKPSVMDLTQEKAAGIQRRDWHNTDICLKVGLLLEDI